MSQRKKSKYAVGQAVVSKVDAGPVKAGDTVTVVYVGKGTYNTPYYKVQNDAGTAFIAEQNLAVQKGLL